MTQTKSPVPSFITFDGIDGVGKSTQIERLAETLRELGHDVMCVRDPGSTEIGTRLRAILLDSDLTMHRRTEAMLFMASRCEMIETVLRPALAAGKTVISDRFLLANVVYQSVGDDQSGPPNVDAGTLWQLGRLSCGGLSPDFTVLLDMPANEAMQRLGGEADRMEARGESYLANVREAFLNELPNTGGTGVVINALGTPDEVAARVSKAVLSK